MHKIKFSSFLFALLGLLFILWVVFSLYTIQLDYVGVYRIKDSDELPATTDSIAQSFNANAVSNTYSICAKRQNEYIASPYDGRECTLYGIHADYPEYRGSAMVLGRRIDITDIIRKKQVAVIDETLARLLFEGQDALGKKVDLDGYELEVVGVCSGYRSIGEADEYIVYVPFSWLTNAGIGTDTLECMVKSAGGSQSEAIIESVFRNVQEDVCIYSLHREKIQAAMPLIVVGFMCFILIWAHFLRFNIKKYKAAFLHAKLQLSNAYLRQCIGKILLLYLFPFFVSILLFLSGYAVMHLFFRLLGVFAPWFPERLTSLEAWANQFWTIFSQASSNIQLSCMEHSWLHMIGKCCQWFALIAVCYAFVISHRYKKKSS